VVFVDIYPADGEGLAREFDGTEFYGGGFLPRGQREHQSRKD
jgi:hypothetical protein